MNTSRSTHPIFHKFNIKDSIDSISKYKYSYCICRSVHWYYYLWNIIARSTHTSKCSLCLPLETTEPTVPRIVIYISKTNLKPLNTSWIQKKKSINNQCLLLTNDTSKTDLSLYLCKDRSGKSRLIHNVNQINK